MWRPGHAATGTVNMDAGNKTQASGFVCEKKSPETDIYMDTGESILRSGTGTLQSTWLDHETVQNVGTCIEGHQQQTCSPRARPPI